MDSKKISLGIVIVIYYKIIEKLGKMVMKKIQLIVITLILTFSTLVGCQSVEEESVKIENIALEENQLIEETKTELAEDISTEENIQVKTVALKGPTAMGMVEFMNKKDQGKINDHNYQFSIVAAVDEVTPLLVKKEVDIAAVPANLASVLYNNTEGEVQVLAINTLGILYLVGTGEEIISIEELRGKTIYASGKGATPEYALNYILEANGLDLIKDVTVEWKSEHTECLTALLAKEDSIALLPQPFVTIAQSKNEQINVISDLNKEWNKLQEGKKDPSALLTGVIVGRKEFIEKNPQVVADFLTHYEESVTYVNGNVDEAAVLVGNYDIVPEAVAKKAIPYCNITFISGSEMKEKLSGYLGVLFEQNPKSIGGKLPEDNFYYVTEE